MKSEVVRDWETFFPIRKGEHLFKSKGTIEKWNAGRGSKSVMVQWKLIGGFCDRCGQEVYEGECMARPLVGHNVGAHTWFHVRCITPEEWHRWLGAPLCHNAPKKMRPSKPMWSKKNVEKGVKEGWITLNDGVTLETLFG